MSGMVTVTGRDELGRIIDVQLTTEADLAPPGPETVSSGNGEQTVRLLGPFHVEHDTVDITGIPGALLADDLPAGCLVIAVHAESSESWDQDADAALLQVRVWDAEDNTTTVGSWLIGDNWGAGTGFKSLSRWVGSEGPTAGSIGAGTIFSLPGETFRTSSEGPVSLYARTVDTAGATQGTADIYALIAEPA